MTPAQQEAERLVERFANVAGYLGRQCAIIHCEEVLSLLGNADETRYATSHYQSVLNILKEK